MHDSLWFGCRLGVVSMPHASGAAWTSARKWGHLDPWFTSWVPESVYRAEVCRLYCSVLLTSWYTNCCRRAENALRVLLVALQGPPSRMHVGVDSPLILVNHLAGIIAGRVLRSLGLPALFRHVYFQDGD